MKNKEHIKHIAFLSVLILVAALSVGLIISGNANAATPGDTFDSANGTYEYLNKVENNVNAGTYAYGSADVIVFKQASAFVVWVDATVPTSEDALIIAAVQELDKSLKNSTGVVTRLTDFWMDDVLVINDSQYEVYVSIDTSAKTFTLGNEASTKGISHYTLIEFTPFTASLVVDKDVTGPNASTTEKFSITVTFSGSNLGGIEHDATDLVSANSGVYTFNLSADDGPVTFSNISYGTTYTVTEAVTGVQATDGWSIVSGAVTEPVTLGSGNSSGTVTLMNKYMPTATLAVDKDVLGDNASTTEAFSITVTFSGDNLADITNNGGLQVASDGIYVLSLSGSTSPVTFSNITYGTTYTVTETVSNIQMAAGWAYTGGAVTEPVTLNDDNKTDSATVVNTYTEPKATLEVYKNVTGTGAATSEGFTVTVTFDGDNLDDIVFSGGANQPGGEYSFDLSAADAPVTFSNITYGTTYTVTEALSGQQISDGWMKLSGEVTQAVTLNSGNPTDDVTLYNNYGPTASLLIDKQVEGTNASTTEPFSITVTFSGDNVNLGDIVYSGGNNEPSGIYTFTLTADAPQPVSFSNIPYGTTYTVTETVSTDQMDNGWAYTSGAVTEAVSLNIENPSDAVVLLNTYTPTALLEVSKSVLGEYASDAEMFDITVTFSGNDLDKIDFNGGANQPGGEYTFQLSGASDPVTFSKIPYGTTYTVTETLTGDQVSAGWTMTSDPFEDIALGENNPDDSVVIENTFTPTARLTVSKTVTGTGASLTEPFSITVTFSGDAVNLGDIDNDAGMDVAINGIYTFSLSGGADPVIFSNIPFGTMYTVTEALSGGQSAAGWSITSGVITQAVELGIDNSSATVNIVNNYGPTASLTVDKNVNGGASTAEPFDITVTFTGNDLDKIANNGNLPVANDGIYTFSLSGGANPVTFSSIPYGTQYTVNEAISNAQAANGWVYSSGMVTDAVLLDIENISDTVVLVNSFTPPPPPPVAVGTLTVTKNVFGDGASTTEEFEVTVQFTGSFGGILNNTGLIGSGGVYTMSLADGESITFSNVPLGISYTVTENITDTQIADGWTGPSSVIDGNIINAVPVNVTVDNVYTETGVAGASDDGGDVAGVDDVLPQTGGISTSTLLGILGLMLVAFGGTLYVIIHQHKRKLDNLQ